MGHCPFFHAGPADALILSCYRLAKFYGCHPDQFLRLTASEIRRHEQWTNRLLIEVEQQSESDK